MNDEQNKPRFCALPLERRVGGWYVVDHSNSDEILRGPMKHQETAGLVRQLMEAAATDAENERWNLWVTHIESPNVEVTGRAQKPETKD